MPKRAFVPEDLLDVKVPSDPRISPDGSSVVYCVKRVAEKSRYATDLFLWSEAGLRQLTSGPENDTSPRWKPDGSSIAFTSNRARPEPGLYELPMAGGEARKIVSLPEGDLGAYEWSPDGKRIAFTYREKSKERTKAAQEKRKEAKESEPPMIVETLNWRLDGDGIFGDDRYRLCVVDVATGKWKVLCASAATGEYSFCWMTNKNLLVSYNPSDNPTLETWDHVVCLLDLKGKETIIEGLPKGQKEGLTRLSNNEAAIIYNDRTKQRYGYKAGRLCYLDTATGKWSDPWKGKDELDVGVWTLSDVKEAGHGGSLVPFEGRLFGDLSRNGSTHVCEFLRNGDIVEMTEGAGEWSLGSLHAETLAMARALPTMLPEIVVRRGSETLYESEHNKALQDEVRFIEGEEAWVESERGTKIQTWTLKPHGFRKGRRYPACLEVHGGPHGMYSCCVFLEMQALAGAGYVVCWSNPRGSTGYGEEFARCIDGDWGNKDWKDVQAVTRHLKSLKFVDRNRVAIMGGSYGGYMVNWAIGHSNDYKCAITDRCVANLLSKSGNSDYTFVPNGTWPGSAFGGDWDVLWDRSPVKHFSKVKTPTLVVHSEGDLRCHIEQGEQVYTFLKMKGVPTRFVRYPANTSHGMSRSGPPDLRIHRLREQLAWYEKYL